MTGSKSPSDPRMRGDAPASPEPERADAGPRLGSVRAAGAIALLAAILILRALGGPAGGPGAQALFDAYQRIHPRAQADGHVSVVLIDPESIRQFGPWPWPRRTIAELVNRIGEARAGAIGIDAQFPEPDRTNPDPLTQLYPRLPDAAKAALRTQPSMDRVLAEEVGHYPVVLARSGILPGAVDYDVAGAPPPGSEPLDDPFSAPLPPGVLAFPRMIANIPDLDDVARGLGVINGAPDPDGVVRSVPLVAKVAGADMPGLALALARVWREGADAGSRKITPLVKHGRFAGVRMAGVTAPAAPDGTMRVRFAADPPPIASAASVLNHPPDAKRFGGKIVLIGVSAAGTTDLVVTPMQARAYGVFVHAQAIESILRGDALLRPHWAEAAEWALGIALGVLAVLFAPMLRGLTAVAIPAAIALLVAGASWLAFERHGLLVDPLRPLLLFATAAVVTVAAEAGRAQRELAGALQEERIGVARAAGELNAARDVQIGMLPPRERLRALHAQVDIDAMIEPARQVGGDLYDAFVLSDGRVCFVIGDVTGKGMPAALFMAISKSQAQSMFRRHADDLGRAMAELNVLLSRDNSQDLFVTLLVGVLDVRTGRLDLCNAGHENPLRVGADGAVSDVVLEGGPPLCVVEDYPYEAESVQLAPGDGLAIVTDGVTEAQDPEGGFFGHNRLVAELARWKPQHEASAAGEALVRAVRDFEAGGEPSDDVTVLLLRWRAG